MSISILTSNGDPEALWPALYSQAGKHHKDGNFNVIVEVSGKGNFPIALRLRNSLFYRYASKNLRNCFTELSGGNRSFRPFHFCHFHDGLFQVIFWLETEMDPCFLH